MLFLLISCLVRPSIFTTDVSDPRHNIVQERILAIDWDAVEKEASLRLQEYIRVDTTNPPGTELQGAEYLARILEEEGIESTILLSAENRGNLIAKLPGKGIEKPLCLLSHIDTVTYEAEKWTHHPLSGHLDEEGYIWGRGALDMKSMGIMELMSLILLKRQQVALDRDIILIAVSDEEDGGTGMQFLVDHHWDQLNCGALINEGGLGLKGAIFPKQNMYPISVGEKGNIWFRMVAKGDSGHGSTPRPNEASEKLLKAIAKIQASPIHTNIHPVLGQFLANVGAQKGGVMSFIMRQPFFRTLLVKPKLEKNPLTKAAMMNTVHLTGFGGFNRPNVVASEVFAQFDCRILPGVEPNAFLDNLKKIAGRDVSFDIITSRSGNESTMDNPVYRALARYAVAGEEGAVAGPVISVGFTDSIYVRPKGTHAYGFVPILLDAEEMNGFHGVNERISEENIGIGTKKLYSAILEVVSSSNTTYEIGH